MIKIDMHVHSKYSEHPSDWFLQRLGAKESYTEPEFLYKTAKERGMDFVTITDHNQIQGAQQLKEKYPDDVLIGVEATTYFPETGCKIHLLLYDINPEQFSIIQEKRKNIFELREYVKEHNLAHSVAHATYSINNKLSVEYLEKLILLFDVFEGINGGRSYIFNFKWMEMLKRLTPSHIENLYRKHNIEPISNDPWIKSFTAGSDDHAGLFIGNTYTKTDADNIEELVDNLKNKKTYAEGNHNNYKYLAFTVYKVAFEFAKSNKKNVSNSLLFQISEKVFESESLNIKDRFKLQQMKSSNKKNGDAIHELLIGIIDDVRTIQLAQIEKRLEIVFDKICDISDEFFKRIFKSLENDISKGDLVSVIMNISSSLPGIFLSLPFLTTLRHMFHNREVIDQVQRNLEIDLPNNGKKILWFTDSINDLNGVSETLKEMGWISYRNNHHIKIVTSVLKNERDKTLPPNTISLPSFFTMRLPYYENLVLKFPSILKSIEILATEEAAEIFISTPGPIGLLGLLLAKLLSIKCTGIYHTDFTRETEKIVEDNALSELVESYTRWFYSSMDHIKVQTNEYFRLLEQRGFDRSKLQLLRKGIDTNLFANTNGSSSIVKEKYRLKDGITLLYVGRISKDKHVDFIDEIYGQLITRRKDINLLIVGNGPYLDAYKQKMQAYSRVRFTGKLPRKELPSMYSLADIFVFPSTTDTFGMVVMEAQSCGLPAVVSDVGGPKEIVIDGLTGLVAEHSNLDDWVQKIESLIEMKDRNEDNYQKMKEFARKNIINKYSWENYFQDIIGNVN